MSSAGQSAHRKIDVFVCCSAFKYVIAMLILRKSPARLQGTLNSILTCVPQEQHTPRLLKSEREPELSRLHCRPGWRRQKQFRQEKNGSASWYHDPSTGRTQLPIRRST